MLMNKDIEKKLEDLENRVVAARESFTGLPHPLLKKTKKSEDLPPLENS